MPIIFITIVLLFAPAVSGGKANSIRIASINGGMSQAFAVETAAGLFLIDAGSPGQAHSILDQLHRFSTKPLIYIIITHAHFDHYGSANGLRALTGAKILIGKPDSSAMARGETLIEHARTIGLFGQLLLPLVGLLLPPPPTIANATVNDGDSLDIMGLPGIVIATPGHTRGSVSLLLHNNIAFVSDLIVTHPVLNCQCYYAFNWQHIGASLEKMQDKKPTLIYAGHAATAIGQKDFLKLRPVAP